MQIRCMTVVRERRNPFQFPILAGLRLTAENNTRECRRQSSAAKFE